MPVENQTRLTTDGDNPVIHFAPIGITHLYVEVDGVPSYIQMDISESDIILLNDELKEMQRKADEGLDTQPFGDYNHENEEASFHPLEFTLGEGTIDIIVEWVPAALEKVKNKEWMYFSPELLIEADPIDDIHHIVGLNKNVGGLTNRPAFITMKRIAQHSPFESIYKKLQQAGIDTEEKVEALIEKVEEPKVEIPADETPNEVVQVLNDKPIDLPVATPAPTFEQVIEKRKSPIQIEYEAIQDPISKANFAALNWRNLNR